MPQPFLLFADSRGKIYSHPYLRMAASSAERFILPAPEEVISLPRGSTLFYMVDRAPVGFNPSSGGFELLDSFQGRRVYAVAAFLIPAYLRLYSPAYAVRRRKPLPLWAYTACGFYAGKIYAAACRVDRRLRQSPRFYDAGEIKRSIRRFIRRYPGNRLYRHLANCALNYNCLAAKNLFLNRWEAPLPTARSCNARCVGCLSRQEDKCTASHQRISFKPGVSELTQVMVNHLKTAKEAIVSFGQGCEGEPLTESALIAEAVRRVRDQVSRGTINMNTNASLPAKVGLLARAGVDSFRVSLNSVQPRLYNSYFRPLNYKFKDILKSIALAKRYGKFVSVNLFVFPGVTDDEREVGFLLRFIRDNGIDMIQWRNLNIDPDIYRESLPANTFRPCGVLNLIRAVTREFPNLKQGYFNVSLPRNLKL